MLRKLVAISLFVSFIAMATSGMMMFVIERPSFTIQMHPVHKLFGLIMILSVIGHLFYNVRSLASYLKEKRAAVFGLHGGAAGGAVRRGPQQQGSTSHRHSHGRTGGTGGRPRLMSDTLIFLPVLAQVALTFYLYIRLMKVKQQAANAGEVDESRRGVYDDAWPKYVQLVNNAIRSQFEVPVLLRIGRITHLFAPRPAYLFR